MNARIDAPKSLFLLEGHQTTFGTEALALLQRALMLTLSLDDAREALRGTTREPITRADARVQASWVFSQLAQTEAERFIGTAGVPEQQAGMIGALDQLGLLIEDPARAKATKVAGLILRILHQSRTQDPVLYRRLNREVDALVYRSWRSSSLLSPP